MPISPRHRSAVCVLTLGLLALTGGCDSSPEAEPAAAATPTTPTTSAASSAPAVPAPPEGTWRAGPVPYSVVVDALNDAALGQWTDAVLKGTSPSSQVSYDMKVQGGFVLLTSTVDDRPLGVQDREGFTADGSTITLEPIGSSCASIFGWHVKADQLTLALTEDTCLDYQGTPDEAYMRALYTAMAFTRVTG
jgi:hypothetical protein